MYGKWVTLALTDEMVIKVFVWCVPGTGEVELKQRAIEQVRKESAKGDTL